MTVHDFRHVLEPKNLAPIIRHAYRKWVAGDVRCADKVVANSAGTSVRMQALLGRKADAIALPAVPLLPLIKDLGEASRALSALGVKQPFLLTVGGSPCKNLGAVVDAVTSLKARKILLDHQLVMVGAVTSGMRSSVREPVHVVDWIKMLGYVDDAVLAALYSMADALVFPSSYEGFGMPVHEARAMGCRVIATESPELREAGGADATYVEPTSESVALGLESALSSTPPPPLRVEHTWSDAAEVMAGILRSVVNQSVPHKSGETRNSGRQCAW